MLGVRVSGDFLPHCLRLPCPRFLTKLSPTSGKRLPPAQAACPVAELERRIADVPPLRNFFAALAAPGPIRLIAEVKKASPSQGVIRADFDPLAIAADIRGPRRRVPERADRRAFLSGQASTTLRAIRRQVGLPVLRKDFILDRYQLLEARAAGADAVLLIAECLDDCHLRSLHNEAVRLGMSPLVELYEPENLPRVFDAGATLIGINNRDLRTFETDLDHTLRMRERVPDECVLVAESGIRTRADVERLQAAGVDAILVGETLMASPDIGAAVDALLGR